MKTRTVYVWRMTWTTATGAELASDGGPYAKIVNAQAAIGRATMQLREDKRHITSITIRELEVPAEQPYMEQLEEGGEQ